MSKSVSESSDITVELFHVDKLSTVAASFRLLIHSTTGRKISRTQLVVGHEVRPSNVDHLMFGLDLQRGEGQEPITNDSGEIFLCQGLQ